MGWNPLFVSVFLLGEVARAGYCYRFDITTKGGGASCTD
jgi:hypothetical protein